nr:MAG TPA: hypothetical protein [Bacteriophage sp.]
MEVSHISLSRLRAFPAKHPLLQHLEHTSSEVHYFITQTLICFFFIICHLYYFFCFRTLDCLISAYLFRLLFRL